MTAQRITSPIPNDFSIDYGWDAEREINRLQEVINQHPHVAHQYPSRWLAIKLLESDEDIRMRIQVLKGGLEILTEVQNSTAILEDIYGDDMEVVIADRRYSWINNLVREAVQRPDIDQQTTTDKIDRILTHRILGIPIFLVAMWVVFKLTADVSAPYLEWVDMVINGPLTRWIVSILGWVGLEGSWIDSLLVDGIIAGVGGGFCSGADDTLPGAGNIGGLWLYGARSFRDGPADAQPRFTWEELSANAGRFRLQCAGNLCYPYPGERKRPHPDRVIDSIHELWSSLAGVCPFFCHLFPSQCWLGDFRHVPDRHPDGDSSGRDPQENTFQR